MDDIEFGKYLSQQRALRGLSLGEVANATRIPENLLKALESAQVDRLPERIFVRNYIRSYAKVIGLSEEEAMLRYDEMGGAAPSETPLSEISRKRRGKAWRQVLAMALVFLILVALVILWVTRNHS